VYCDDCKTSFDTSIEVKTKKGAVKIVRDFGWMVYSDDRVYCPICTKKRRAPKALSPGKRVEVMCHECSGKGMVVIHPEPIDLSGPNRIITRKELTNGGFPRSIQTRTCRKCNGTGKVD
jgi:hypothetical protein